MFSNVSSSSNIVFPMRHVKIMFKHYTANVNNTLRFVRANVSQKMFPTLPTVVGGKHDKTSTGNNVSATMFPSLPRA